MRHDNDRELPELLANDPEAKQMMEVWVTGEGGSVVLLPMAGDVVSMNMPEHAMWGMLMADAFRHIGLSRGKKQMVYKALAMMLRELNDPHDKSTSRYELNQILDTLKEKRDLSK